MRRHDQPGLFATQPSLPEGFKYAPVFLSHDEEQDLLRNLGSLPFKGFEFQGFVGNRQVVSFGWHYDFNQRELRKADDLPPFLLPLRGRAAAFAGLTPADFQHVLVTSTAPGPASAGTATRRSSTKSSGSPWAPRATSASAASGGPPGSGQPSSPSPVRFTC